MHTVQNTESKILRIEKLNGDTRYIVYQPTRWCNWYCSYCIQREKKEASMPPEDTLVEEAKALRAEIDALQERWPKAREQISFLGGEVGFYDMYRLLEPLLTDKTRLVTLTTNGTAPKENYTALYKRLSERGVALGVIVSFHDEYDTPVSFKDRISGITGALTAAGMPRFRVRAQCTVNSRNLAVCKKLGRICSEHDIPVGWTPERGTGCSVIYHPDSVLRFIQENSGAGGRCSVEWLDGTIAEYTRDELLSMCDGSKFSCKAWTCSDRHAVIRYDRLTGARLNCRSRDGISVLEEPDSIECPRYNCSLCSRIVLRRPE